MASLQVAVQRYIYYKSCSARASAPGSIRVWPLTPDTTADLGAHTHLVLLNKLNPGVQQHRKMYMILLVTVLCSHRPRPVLSVWHTAILALPHNLVDARKTYVFPQPLQ
jgi:hypothetical protein